MTDTTKKNADAAARLRWSSIDLWNKLSQHLDPEDTSTHRSCQLRFFEALQNFRVKRHEWSSTLGKTEHELLDSLRLHAERLLMVVERILNLANDPKDEAAVNLRSSLQRLMRTNLSTEISLAILDGRQSEGNWGAPKADWVWPPGDPSILPLYELYQQLLRLKRASRWLQKQPRRSAHRPDDTAKKEFIREMVLVWAHSPSRIATMLVEEATPTGLLDFLIVLDEGLPSSLRLGGRDTIAAVVRTLRKEQLAELPVNEG